MKLVNTHAPSGRPNPSGSRKASGILSARLPTSRATWVPRTGDYNLPFKGTESAMCVVKDTRLSVPSITLQTQLITVGQNVKTGSSNPNWRNLLEKGLDASSSYTRRGVVSTEGARMKLGASTFNRWLPGYRIDFTSSSVLVGQLSVQFSSDAETQNRALAKFKKQLASRAGSYQTMAPLAECKELAGLVRQASAFTYKTLKSVYDLRKGRGKAMVNHLKDTWLGWNFGVSPMLHDIDGIGQAIAAYIARQDLKGRLSATATRRGMYSYVPSHTIAPPYGSAIDAKGTAAYTLSYRYVGAFELFLKSSNNWSMFDQLHMGLGDIPATLWELTALSWIADYFTNVGQFLEDAFVSPPGDTSYLVMDRRYELTAQHYFSGRVLNGTGLTETENSPGWNEIKYFEFQRTPLTKLPHIGLYIRSTDQMARYGVSKLLNLISVMR